MNCTFSERPHTFCSVELSVELRDRIHARTRTSQSAAEADESARGGDGEYGQHGNKRRRRRPGRFHRPP
ncbi:hypothetical protein, partial [Streptomyces sp. MBT55]|uniref:hypothetical protein n=1 Tax=Streptomyces sp. MBT55 TaxID=1488386 RepID=UPI001F1A6B0F